MKTAVTRVAAAGALTLGQTRVMARSPVEWIAYDDATHTPVIDDASQALADARTALAKKDYANAAHAMRAAARALQVQAERAGRIDRQRAAADMKLTRETHVRMVALRTKREATAASVRLEPARAVGQARQGLEGEVIRRVQGQALIAAGELPALTGPAAPGEKVAMEVWRQGRPAALTAGLSNASARNGPSANADEAGQKGKRGLALRPVQPQERREAGVRAGHGLMAVNGTPVTTIDQIPAAMAPSDKSVVRLIRHEGSKIFVPVRIG